MSPSRVLLRAHETEERGDSSIAREFNWWVDLEDHGYACMVEIAAGAHEARQLWPLAEGCDVEEDIMVQSLLRSCVHLLLQHQTR